MKITKTEANDIRLKRLFISQEFKNSHLPIDQFVNIYARQINADYYQKETKMADNINDLNNLTERYNEAKRNNTQLPVKEQKLRQDINDQRKATFLNAFAKDARYAVLASMVQEAKAARHWYDFFLHPFNWAKVSRAAKELETQMESNHVSKERVDFINDVYQGDTKPNGFTVEDNGKTIYESLEEIEDEENLDLVANEENNYDMEERKQIDLTDEIEDKSEEKEEMLIDTKDVKAKENPEIEKI